MRYFDSHAHYFDERFKTEYEKGAEHLIGANLSSCVSGIVNVGTSPETSKISAEMAEKFDKMFCAIGIHPSDCQELNMPLDKAIYSIETLIAQHRKKCVALGEIGFDYHYPDTDKDIQKEYFISQMELAKKTGLPVVIHDRDAHEDVMNIVRAYGKEVRGVFHSFSGSSDMAKELCRLGYMVSFSGTITFTNARRPKEAAAAIPMENILIETDCPYLSPHPHRGKLNHSGMLEYTNRTLAEIKGIGEEECAAITAKNAEKFFGICLD